MFSCNRYPILLFLGILNLIFLHSGCQDTLESEVLVYSNDFSTQDLTNFENAKLFIFESNTVLGSYNNEEVSVVVPDLPSHNILRITIEILIHDSWDGNTFDGISGPDIWYMKIDNKEIYMTTFSNSPCESTYCLKQSYPDDSFRQNDPKSGAVQTNLPGLCLFGGSENYTTRYRISKLVEHKGSKVRISLGEELKKVGIPNPICDESWSLAKVTVAALVVD